MCIRTRSGLDKRCIFQVDLGQKPPKSRQVDKYLLLYKFGEIRYNPTMQNDTIAAIATPPGIGGVGVIRVSGPEAFAIVLPLFRQPGGRTSLPPSHLLTYGQVVDPKTEEIMNEGLSALLQA